MKHLGDITKISGYEAPVVDCIIGGSPCQDLSVAGKRAGLAGARSGLYMDQIRIIKEMRDNDRRNGRTGVDIRPRYMVWENVPGAFSSNKGRDFAAVLEEAIRIAEPEAPDISVPEKGWTTAGCIMGECWSVAWRVLDAQFWGTSDKPLPQRRRRIALVADFGGLSAPEILFVRESVSGNIEPGEQKRKRTAGAVEDSAGAAVPCTLKIRGGCEGGGKGALIQTDKSATLSTLQDQTLFQPVVDRNILDDQGGQQINVRTDGKCPTLRAEMHGNIPCVMEPKTFDARGNGEGDISCTLTGGHQSSISDYTSLVIEPATVCLEGNGQHPSHRGDGYAVSDTMFTLNTVDRHGVAYSINHQGGNVEQIIEDKAGTLTAAMNSSGNNKLSVAYAIGAYHSNAWKSDNPNSGVYEADTAKTLDALQCGYPACNQGGMEIVQPVTLMDAYQHHGYRENDTVGTLTAGQNNGVRGDTPLVVAGHAVCGQTLYRQGGFADYCNNVVRVRHIVRRLTPLECERLQGFPDGWTDIGEWVDSKGKKHKEADSPRYKALGNSIALPPWKWVLKRLCACYERDATMASLFDGIGGFPYIWEQLNGKGSCLWASEIEEFPMAVTKLRFGE